MLRDLVLYDKKKPDCQTYWCFVRLADDSAKKRRINNYSFYRNDWHVISFVRPVNVKSIYIQVRYKDLN